MLTKKQLYAKKRYQEKREYLIKQATEYHIKNRESINKKKAEKRRERGEAKKEYTPIVSSYTERGEILPTIKGILKEKILLLYGEKCFCCGETEKRFLTVDHINNDGHKEKSNDGTRIRGDMLYRRILQGNKRDDIRILCFNCNIGRNNNGGECPHIKGESPKA